MDLKKLHKLIAKGRIKAIIKDLPGGRRMLVGFERKSPNSRKAGVKYFSKPIDMAELNKPTKGEPCSPPPEAQS